MRRTAVALALLAAQAGPALAAPATITQLPSGNGYGFLIFDGGQQRVTTWLDRPYRYTTPSGDPKALGVPSRDLAYDVYFGVRAGATSGWLPETTSATSFDYVDASHLVRHTTTIGPLKATSTFWLPFDYAGNALVAVVEVENTSSAAVDVELFANPNLHLGAGAPDPSADGETIAFFSTYALESGAAGKVVHHPIGGFDRADCAGTGYQRVKGGQDLADTPRSASGNDLTLLWQKHVGSLAPGAKASWGIVLATGSDGAATDATVTTLLGARSAAQLVTDALAEHAAWRTAPPATLSPDELLVWRQSETVLRMAQVREPWQVSPKQKGHGMILASLPPGQWAVGWVRDAQYATQALLASGHLPEARDAVEFFLNAEAGSYQQYVGRPYRISVTRYFGDGQEESDWNADGPNPEFDGFGTFLWSAAALNDAMGASQTDQSVWLDGVTRANEPYRDVLDTLVVAPLLDGNLEASGLIAADAGIWEVHWGKRRHFAYTSLAAARGLCDLGRALTDSNPTRAKELITASSKISTAVRSQLVDPKLVLASSTEELGGAHLDGAVLEAFNWGLIADSDAVTSATLDAMAGLKASSGGYFRNDDGGSYDAQEWIYIDLRYAQALRRAGRSAEADALLAHVTAVGKASHGLLPELLNTDAGAGQIGDVAGSWPMVGFGAGAYLLALAHREGIYDEARACPLPGTTPKPPTKPGHGCATTGDDHPGGALLLVGIAYALLHNQRRRPHPLP